MCVRIITLFSTFLIILHQMQFIIDEFIIISIFNLASHPLYVHAIHKLIILLYLSFVTNLSVLESSLDLSQKISYPELFFHIVPVGS